MANSADPDQLASEKPTDLDLHCKGSVYQGSTRQGLNCLLGKVVKCFLACPEASR